MKITTYILLICIFAFAVIPSHIAKNQKIVYNKATPIDSGNKDCSAGVQPEYVKAIILSIYSEIIPSRLKAIYYEFYQKPRYC